MFRLDPSPTFTVRVPLSRPGADMPVQVTFTFRHKTVREITDWLRRGPQMDSDVEFVGEIVEGWGAEILGPDDKPVPYSVEALGQLLNAFPGAGAEIVLTYRKALKDARVGN